jgi:hypothetical protein
MSAVVQITQGVNQEKADSMLKSVFVDKLNRISAASNSKFSDPQIQKLIKSDARSVNQIFWFL